MKPNDVKEPMKPRKDERASAAKLLKSEAMKFRNHAEGHRKMVRSEDRGRWKDHNGWLLKEAARKEKKADIWEKVATWIME